MFLGCVYLFNHLFKIYLWYTVRLPKLYHEWYQSGNPGWELSSSAVAGSWFHTGTVPWERCGKLNLKGSVRSWAGPEGGQGVRNPRPRKNYKIIGFLSDIGPDPLKSQSYQASIKCWAIICPPAKRHSIDGTLLVLFGFSLPSSKKTRQRWTSSGKAFWIRAWRWCKVLLELAGMYVGCAVGNVSGYRCVVWLQIQGSRVRSRPGPILSWRLIMK